MYRASIVLFAAAVLLNAQIHFDAARGVFVIQTGNTTYALEKNQAGAINHTYWGPRINREADLPVAEEVRYARGLVGAYQKERFREEYVGWGGYFYDEPALKVSFADGSRVLKLLYKSHEIDAGERSNTLRLTLADSHYPIVVTLYYRIYAGLDLIDRWAEISNRGQQPITIECAQSATWYVPRSATGSRTFQEIGVVNT